MARRRKAMPPQPSRTPRTEWQRRRDDALSAAGYTKKDVWAFVTKRGAELSLATVRAVLNARHWNDDVIAAFCEMTGMARDVAFPLDEPRNAQQPVQGKYMTKRRRAQGFRPLSAGPQADDAL